MNRADCKALRSAALQLLDWAAIMYDSHIDNDSKWSEENGPAQQRLHDKHVRTAKRLRAIANAEQAKLPKSACNHKDCGNG